MKERKVRSEEHAESFERLQRVQTKQFRTFLRGRGYRENRQIMAMRTMLPGFPSCSLDATE